VAPEVCPSEVSVNVRTGIHIVHTASPWGVTATVIITAMGSVECWQDEIGRVHKWSCWQGSCSVAQARATSYE